jgi:CRISPR-associated endonuclease/helicase Cas3
VLEKSYYKYWGKARKKENGKGWDCQLLPYHCLDVAAVGNALLKLNANILPSFRSMLNRINVNPQIFTSILLALHDFGKFSKSFQAIVPELQLKLQVEIRGKPGSLRHDEIGALLWRSKYRNAFESEVIRKYGLTQGIGIIETVELLINISTGHHGIPPKFGQTAIIDALFDSRDFKSVESLWNDLNSLLGIEKKWWELLQSLSQNRDIIKLSSWEIAGFLTLSDWVGSNNTYFELVSEPETLERYWNKAIIKAERAITELGLINANVQKKYSFNNLLPTISQSLTPLQKFCDTFEMANDPQLWILEDVTGAGKTEAALILTARLMEKGLARGIFIALPTMATSDAMYKRLSKQYKKLFDKNSFPSLILSHGARHLSKEFRQSFLNFPVQKNTTVTEVDESFAQCNRWLTDSNKKALLADAGIGTIDQVLISILPARHQSLRLFGLEGKVLIIDEVHAYDDYQNRLLSGVLEHHAQNGGSAILLSATLPKTTRESLINSYLKGFGKNKPIEIKKNDYPLATHVRSDGKCIECTMETRDDLKRSVKVKFETNYDEIINFIIKEARNGKCCCWIRNTVADALKSYDEIALKYSKNLVSLLHSRFTYADRILKESELLNQFGPGSNSISRKGKIVVATQVIEQSLDVDFDVMVSDLAPIDYIVQRVGRLCRHKRDVFGNPADIEARESLLLTIYGPTPEDVPSATWYSEVLNGASFVYKNHAVLWKTQQALIAAGQKISTPGKINDPSGIRNLIQAVYGESAIATPESLQIKEDNAIGDSFARDGMGRLNMLSLQEGYSSESSGFWYEEVQVPTRIGDVQIMVYLTKIVENKLQSLEEGEYPWDLSSIRVRAGLIIGISFEKKEMTLIEDLKKGTSRLMEKDFVIPLSWKEGEWFCFAQKEEKGPCKIIYSQERGLEIIMN